jgi:hypothetical protein
MRTSLFGLFLFIAVPGLALRAADFKPEPGFEMLFNGKDLSGWQLDLSKAKAKKDNEPLDGKTEAAAGRFKVADGVLVIDPKVKGDTYITTNRKLPKDFIVRFEYNPGPGCNNDLLFRGAKFDIKDIKTDAKSDVTNIKIGEWNAFEIIVTGDKAEFKNNGEALKSMPVKAAPTGFTLRAEGGGIQYRNIRVKE